MEDRDRDSTGACLVLTMQRHANEQELHNCLELDKSVKQGSFRTTWVVGSFQFYKFYRVFSPYEEIPSAIDMMFHELNVEVCSACASKARRGLVQCV